VTARETPPYRADHVGSLLRPKRLTDARAEHAAGRLSAEQLRAIEDDAIREVVRQQEEVGLRSATDGEFRRTTWHMDFIDSLGGITHAEERISVRFHNESGTIEWQPTAMRVSGRVTLEEPIFADHFRFVQSCVTTATPKLTIPSPSMLHYRGGRASIDAEVYPELDEFWSDVTNAYAAEVRALGDIGCTYLQFDDTSLAYLNDPEQRDFVTKMGGDPEHLHEDYIRHINEALEDRPEGMTVTTHLCRGNFQSSWVAQGGYDYIAEALFNELAVDGLFLEFDDERSGTFEPLRFLPPGKIVVLGLVTTKRGELESKDELKRRIEDAARFVDVDQLCLSGQCGFSSTVEGNALTHEQQWAKLRLIVETAEEVWGQLDR
jgi:5-methyltetrahydropteroyltriglutamate--homocysteine methyltransferase